MNKRQIKKNKEDKKDKEITYQEAWNKISEFMMISSSFTYFVSPWTKNDKHKYSLQILENGKETDLLIANKEWIR